MSASLDAALMFKQLGSIAYLDASSGLKSAKAADTNPDRKLPFGGVPFLVKDLGGPFAGWPVAAGSSAFTREDGVPDSDLASGFRSAGFCTFGLTTVPEFGLSLASEPAIGPQCRNPLSTEHSAGGSSGGAAAAVASGIVAIAHATDAGGSIRVPAACCGLVGLKPGRGAVPGGPGFGNYLGGIASELAVCRSVRDTVSIFKVIQESAKAARPHYEMQKTWPDKLRLGVLTSTGENYPTGRDQIGVVEAAAKSLEGDGHQRIDLIWAQMEPLAKASADAFASIVCVNLAELFATMRLDVSKTERLTQAAIEKGLQHSSIELWARLNSMVHVAYKLWQIFEEVDCIIAPMLSSPPKKLGSFPTDHSDIDGHFDRMTAFSPTASLANISGFPAITLPFGSDRDGFPLPVQLIAPLGRELLLLHIAQRLESEQRWQHRFPVAGLPQ